MDSVKSTSARTSGSGVGSPSLRANSEASRPNRARSRGPSRTRGPSKIRRVAGLLVGSLATSSMLITSMTSGCARRPSLPLTTAGIPRARSSSSTGAKSLLARHNTAISEGSVPASTCSAIRSPSHRTSCAYVSKAAARTPSRRGRPSRPTPDRRVTTCADSPLPESLRSGAAMSFATANTLGPLRWLMLSGSTLIARWALLPGTAAKCVEKSAIAFAPAPRHP